MKRIVVGLTLAVFLANPLFAGKEDAKPTPPSRLKQITDCFSRLVPRRISLRTALLGMTIVGAGVPMVYLARDNTKQRDDGVEQMQKFFDPNTGEGAKPWDSDFEKQITPQLTASFRDKGNRDGVVGFLKMHAKRDPLFAKRLEQASGGDLGRWADRVMEPSTLVSPNHAREIEKFDRLFQEAVAAQFRTVGTKNQDGQTTSRAMVLIPTFLLPVSRLGLREKAQRFLDGGQLETINFDDKPHLLSQILDEQLRRGTAPEKFKKFLRDKEPGLSEKEAFDRHFQTMEALLDPPGRPGADVLLLATVLGGSAHANDVEKLFTDEEKAEILKGISFTPPPPPATGPPLINLPANSNPGP